MHQSHQHRLSFFPCFHWDCSFSGLRRPHQPHPPFLPYFPRGWHLLRLRRPHQPQSPFLPYSLGAGTFADCSGLTSLNLPASLTSIGESHLRKVHPPHHPQSPRFHHLHRKLHLFLLLRPYQYHPSGIPHLYWELHILWVPQPHQPHQLDPPGIPHLYWGLHILLLLRPHPYHLPSLPYLHREFHLSNLLQPRQPHLPALPYLHREFHFLRVHRPHRCHLPSLPHRHREFHLLSLLPPHQHHPPSFPHLHREFHLRRLLRAHKALLSRQCLRLPHSKLFYRSPPSTYTTYWLSSKTGFTAPIWQGYPAVRIDEATYPAASWLLENNLPYDTDLHQDPDGDGVSHLMAYALNLDPRLNLSASLPAPVLHPDRLSLTFHAATAGHHLRGGDQHGPRSMDDRGRDPLPHRCRPAPHRLRGQKRSGTFSASEGGGLTGTDFSPAQGNTPSRRCSERSLGP